MKPALDGVAADTTLELANRPTGLRLPGKRDPVAVEAGFANRQFATAQLDPTLDILEDLFQCKVKALARFGISDATGPLPFALAGTILWRTAPPPSDLCTTTILSAHQSSM